MHILHVIDSLDIGGAERAAVDLANAFAKNGFRISFCTTWHAGKLAADLSSTIAAYHLNRTKRFDRAVIRQFRDIVQTNQVDIVHSHMRSTAAFMTMLKTLGWLKIPLLFQDHYGIEIDASVPKWLSWWGKRMIDAYVGVYPKHCQWAESAGFHDNRISYVSYGMDLSRLDQYQIVDVRQEFKLPNDRLIGIVIGNLRLEKGTDTLIQVIVDSEIAKEAIYLVIGRDADPEFARKCRDLVAQHNLRDVVRFVGPREDVPALLRGVDFAVMPSRSESGPLVLIEYLTAGLPFVSFNVGDLANQISQRDVSSFAPPGNIVRLRQALENLLQLSPNERLKRGVKGREVAKSDFSIESKLNEWQKIYQKLLTRGRQ